MSIQPADFLSVVVLDEYESVTVRRIQSYCDLFGLNAEKGEAVDLNCIRLINY